MDLAGYKNTVENLVIAIVIFLVGAGAGHLLTFRTQNETQKQVLEQLKPLIEQAINKETIANTINNAIDMKIDKIKKSDSIQINIRQEPLNDLKPNNSIESSELPTLKVNKEKRKKFLGIF